MISTTDDFTIPADASSSDMITDEPYIRLLSNDEQLADGEMHSKITAAQCLAAEVRQHSLAKPLSRGCPFKVHAQAHVYHILHL